MSNTQKKDDFFKIDVECHVVGNQDKIKHFPGVQMWWTAVDGCKRALWEVGAPPGYLESLPPQEREKRIDIDALVEYMDKYGVDIACLIPESMMETTGYSHQWSTNMDALEWYRQYPNRFMLEPNVSPIKQRGLKNVLWELEYWVKEHDARIFKFYPPEDTFINDPEIWPFYEKAQELGAVISIHAGVSMVPPGKSKYGHPILIDDVARDFPELKIVAFHMGYPYFDEMNAVAMAHPNVHVSLTELCPWGINAPYKFAKMLGEALRFAGPDKISWGTDYIGLGLIYNMAVNGLLNFEMPEELQRNYGYPPVTDELKAKIFGGNLGKLLGIDTSVRRINK